MRPAPGMRGRVMAVRAWPVWGLAPWLRTYIIVVLLADLLAVGLAVRVGLGSGHDLALLAVLVACDAATIEVYRRAGENAGVIKGGHGGRELPIAILLPPIYGRPDPVPAQPGTQCPN